MHQYTFIKTEFRSWPLVLTQWCKKHNLGLDKSKAAPDKCDDAGTVSHYENHLGNWVSEESYIQLSIICNWY